MRCSDELLPLDSRLLCNRICIELDPFYDEIRVKICNLLEMLMINVGVHSKQSFQNSFDTALKMWWKLDTDLARKQCLIIQLILHPCHQVVNVFGSGTLDGLLNCLTIGPMVLILGSSRHDGTPLFRAEFSYRPVQHVNLVEKIHRVDGYPFIYIFTFG